MTRAGAHHYRKMCQHCHGAPGGKAATFAQGLTPPPPEPQKTVSRWRVGELLWIVEHGFKATGGDRHAEPEQTAPPLGIAPR